MKKFKRLSLLIPSLLLLTGCNTDAIKENLSKETFLGKLVPNWLSFVTQLAALIVLLILVIVFAYKPVKKIISKRQEYIENNIKEAEQSKATWKEKESQSEEMVLASKRKANDIINVATKEAKAEKEKILAEAQEEVVKMKKSAEEDIQRMEKEAEEEIKKEMVSVALDASKELLKREVNSKDNSKLVEEFIEEIRK